MTTSVELRELCAQTLLAAADRAGQLTAFVGLDGFVDEILHVVDKRMDAQNYERVPTIARLAERMAEAAGKSTNIELNTLRSRKSTGRTSRPGSGATHLPRSSKAATSSRSLTGR